jgi:hypothetical protein
MSESRGQPHGIPEKRYAFRVTEEGDRFVWPARRLNKEALFTDL